MTSGNDATFQETLAVAPNAPDGGTLHCTVQFLLNGNPIDGFSQSVAIDVPLRPTDISLTKSGPAHVTEGNAITYTLVATNNGPDADTNVVATDTLPARTAFAAADPGCTAAASVVTCMFGTIAGGGSASKQITVNVLNGAPSLLTNTASVTGYRPDSNTPATMSRRQRRRSTTTRSAPPSVPGRRCGRRITSTARWGSPVPPIRTGRRLAHDHRRHAGRGAERPR